LSKIKNNLDYLVVFIDMLLVLGKNTYILADKLRKIAKTRDFECVLN